MLYDECVWHQGVKELVLEKLKLCSAEILFLVEINFVFSLIESNGRKPMKLQSNLKPYCQKQASYLHVLLYPSQRKVAKLHFAEFEVIT